MKLIFVSGFWLFSFRNMDLAKKKKVLQVFRLENDHFYFEEWNWPINKKKSYFFGKKTWLFWLEKHSWKLVMMGNFLETFPVWKKEGRKEKGDFFLNCASNDDPG